MQNNPLMNILNIFNIRTNPQTLAQNLLANNPDIAKKIGNNNPKEIALEMCRQMGVDPRQVEQILSQIRE